MADSPGSARRFEGYVPGFWAVDSYGNGGFRFAGMSHKGSILATPSGISLWPVMSAGDVDEAGLGAVLAEDSGVEFLIIGTGSMLQPVSAEVRVALRVRRISCEVMDTPAAIRTYHVLAGEARRVAAALIAVP